MKKIITVLLGLLSSIILSSFTVAMAAENQLADASQTIKVNNLNQKDGEVIAWLMVLDKNEIAVSKLALTKQNINPDVVAYAKMMVSHHSKNLNDTIVISKKINQSPLQTDKVVVLKNNGKKELNSLNRLNGNAFSTTYIKAMVNGHTQALSALKADLAKVNNADLKNHLAMTMKTVATHLKQAKQLASQLNSTNS